MKINSTWSDDHLPCVEFELEGKTYDLCWTDHGLIGKLELVEDGSITLNKALKKFPELIAALNGKLEPEENETSDDGEETKVWYCDAGCLTLYVTPKKQ